jgi:hypothetical protein
MSSAGVSRDERFFGGVLSDREPLAGFQRYNRASGFIQSRAKPSLLAFVDSSVPRYRIEGCDE